MLITKRLAVSALTLGLVYALGLALMSGSASSGAPMPEPAVLMVLGMGLLTLGLVCRHRAAKVTMKQ